MIKDTHQKCTIKPRPLQPAAVFITALLFALAFSSLCGLQEASAASLKAKAEISSDDVNLRSAPTTSSEVVDVLSSGTSVSIRKEVFKSGTSNSKTKRWYYVSAGGKKGYVRADLVKGIRFSSTAGTTTDDLNYRKGPATTFERYGTADSGTGVTLQLPAKRSGSSDKWYRAEVGGRTAYLKADYVSTDESPAPADSAAASGTDGTSSAEPAKPEEPELIQPPADLSGRSDLAVKLLSNPTKGGKARYVYTFNGKNCTKKFAVKGHKNAWVPQGMAFTGSEYHIVFGMSDRQSIVTYSADGKRLAGKKFSFNMGHPNGITWDPLTGLCYIFKGNQTTIYTWDPATRKFGKARTPYSSSGVAYDSSAGKIYASSKTGIRVYSADGKFTHEKLFSRCKHSFYHYIQDCGAGEGFVFHGISGSDKHSKNYLDVYRVSDGAYLGTIKVKLGETESVIVNNEGYVELLINHSGTYTEYIWQTPLNVNELKL